MPESAAMTDTRRKVKEILRRDLKLGPDARIDDDMPLFNSDADLDSLDLLLLVSSIEREFGFRIPNESVGEAIFKSVDMLASYIQANQHQKSGGTVTVVPTMASVLDQLPHREPFRFVSKITSLAAGKSAEGVWSVTGTEAFFAGHFPGRPIVPGVLIAEALAQISGLIATVPGQEQGKLAHVDVRFESPVAPPADIVLKSKLAGAIGSLQQFEVVAEFAGKSVARGTVALVRGDGASL
jgi:3-hydroxyacyl-[acyl-carrier-protein] dehydratase